LREAVAVGNPAPDFALPDYLGNNVKLSAYRGRANVLLVLNRGLMCPYCRKNLQELAGAYAQFQERKTEILSIGADSAAAFQRFWSANSIPFPGLPDPERRVLRKYGQQVRLMRLGRLPAVLLVDRQGIVRYVHYGGSMMDIPPVQELLGWVDRVNKDQSTPPAESAE